MAFVDKAIPYSNRRLRLIAKAFLESEQEGRCAICRTVGALVVDHDHASGAIRGLLCNACNVALGMFKEHPDYFLRAILYLGWQGKGGTLTVPRCERCNRQLAGYVEGRWSIRCHRCKHQNVSGTMGEDEKRLTQDDLV